MPSQLVRRAPNAFGYPNSFGMLSYRLDRFVPRNRNGSNPHMSTDPLLHATLPTIDPVSHDRDLGPVVGSGGQGGLPHKVPPRRHFPTGAPPPSDPGAFFPAGLFSRPSSVLVHGPSRASINLALFALAESTTPEFQWVDIGVPGEERVASDPVRLGWIPHERLWLVDRPESLRPDDLAANLALFGLIRSDEPPASLAQVTEFLRLPELSQRILALRPEDGRPGALAVTNAQRVMAMFPTHRVPPILAVHQNAGFSLFVGYADTAGPGQNLFDFVFYLDCENVSEWRRSHLVCTKGISTGPLREARAVPLEQIPVFAKTFSRAVEPR